MIFKKPSSKEVIFTLISWVIVLSAINFLCGLIVKNTYIAVDAIDEKAAQNSFGYFKPDQDKVILFPGLEPYHVRINSLGLRSVGPAGELSLEEIQNKYRILAMGDSLTFGLFVDDEDSYPYRLQNILSEEGKNAVVLNAGVGSATITDYIYYLKVKGLALRPDLVTINFCTNDLGEMKKDKPLYQKMKEDNKFSLGKTIKLTKFMRIFRKFELDYRFNRWMKKIKDDAVRKAIVERSQNIDDIMKVAAYHAGTPVTDPFAAELKESWANYFKALDELAALLKENHAGFLYIIYPDIVTVFDGGKRNYQDIIIPYLERNGIEYLDLRPVFQANKDSILEIYNDLPRDFHLDGLGAQLLAEEFYERIKDKIR
ncbi:MAG: hypothetical protein A2Z88_00200 [Omnitrophica WOR_2 bacterium GWA2_47_8]|nr:MAG: hypothetical protein A2Z88_00200 [Omnitrophica WOR_2 bacterium GWA2_47_8]